MAGPQNVAIIGLGSMGLGMARSLIRAGHIVSGCDINEAARESLASAGGEVATSPAKAAEGADIVVVVVVNAAQTEEVLYGAQGAFSTMKSGAVIISSATVSPTQAKSFAERANQKGVLYLDAPISGGSVKADAGKLTVMASGTPQAFAAARPALDAMADTVYGLGDTVGIGSSFKIVNQLLAGVHIAAACEAITFAKSLDLDISKVFEVISKSAGNSWMFENRIPHVLAGDYTPHSAVSIFTKDLGIVSDLGRAQKFPLPIASAALQLFLMTEAAGMGRDDDASVARLLARITGLKLPGMEDED
ncbi:3-hydroxyisobutyrate dehydrogenase [Pararhizobium capsulatum DSM 1112]|uniref:L-threonate dehydrogenase n=1 Tax=Pararhizobium capsulatum DSM 1112 TaxID=1121113 RepID=A0ABU0BXC7_9HYPH|nr:L-threonate dehydrogenase [Pararhizobium capsulatum]MDQ0322613.1 3-hydroxyisobutyrate dehydrogenase [Pararhizobium capsulatum DSM 1112]